MRKPLHKRSRKWPTIDDFWNSDQPVFFRMIASDQSNWRAFRTWLRRHMRKIEEDPSFDYDTEVLALHKPTLDICLGDFAKLEEVNHEMAVFKWNAGEFMTQEEIDKLPEDRKPIFKTPPKAFDLSKAEKVYMDKSALKVQEIQAEQEKLTSFV